MFIEVRLFTSLRNNRKNRYYMEVEPELTPQDLADKLGIAGKDISMVLINGRTENITCELKDGDIVSLFPSIGGG